MNKTTMKLKSIALSALCFMSLYSNAQAPAFGSAGYNTWKQSLVAPGASNQSLPGTVNSIGTAPGCFFPPTATGYTVLPGNDDGSTGLISLPFTFCLYGVNRTSLYINNNGNITFGSPTSTFTPVGFPGGTSLPMIAPFWGDVITWCGDPTHIMQYKVEAHRLIATWTNVEYFNVCGASALHNTFQVIISDGTDPGIGIGNNVAFYYGDMQWTTGGASGGSGGFGGGAATVGINAGNFVNFVQIGRFSQNNAAYDGGGGSEDGVNYLDYECFTFNVCGATNQPPSVSGAPLNNTITIPCGTTGTLNLSFLPPEVAQTVSAAINTGGLCGTTINSNTSGAVANTSVSIAGSACNVGTHHIIYTATDNFTPAASTTVDITVIVTPCTTGVPTMSEWSLIILGLISLSIGMIFIYKRRNSFAFGK